MKMTLKKANVILTRYEELITKAQQFLRETNKTYRGYPNIRFSDGNIEEYVNTACHCHPEMSWETAATMEEFGKWLDEQAKLEY